MSVAVESPSRASINANPAAAPTAAAPPHPSAFTREFWLGRADLRALGLYRIIVGSVAAYDVLRRLEEFRAWHTDEGVLPRVALVEGIARAWRLSVLDMLASTPAVGVAFAVGLLASVSLALGYKTRLANIVAWVFAFSVQERNLGVTDSSDILYRVMLFWMIFSPAGSVYSLDALLARKDREAPAAWPPMGSAVALRMMQLQVLIVYFVTSVTKNGPTWREGSAAYRALQVWDFARPTAGFFADHFSFMAQPLTWGTLVIEFSLATLLWVPNVRVKKAVLLGGLMLHGGIEVMLNVGMFSLMMFTVYTLFLWPSAMDKVDRAFARMSGARDAMVRFFRTRMPDGAEPDKDWVGRPANTRILAVLSVVMGTIMWDQVHECYNPFPRPPEPFAATMESFSLWQNWRMFAPNPVFDSGPWTAEGTLQDGTKIDVLAAGAPGFKDPPPWRLWHSRWNKYRLHVRTPEQRGYLLWLGKYLCRQVNAKKKPGEPLLDNFEMIYHLRTHRSPWEPAVPEVPTSMWKHYCIKVPGT